MSPSSTPAIDNTSGVQIVWDTFVPDLIVGLFTGLVVGVILAYLQSRSARKRERRETELRWEALRPRVGAQLLNPWDRRVMGDSLTEFASRTDTLRNLTAEVPLASWAEILNDQELRDLHELMKVSTQLRGAAPKFDGFLNAAIAMYLHQPRGWQGRVYPFDSAAEALVQPFVFDSLFRRTLDELHPSSYAPSYAGSYRDIRYESAVVMHVKENPPVTYEEVLSMIKRAEGYYGACAVSIVDDQMTRYWFD